MNGLGPIPQSKSRSVLPVVGVLFLVALPRFAFWAAEGFFKEPFFMTFSTTRSTTSPATPFCTAFLTALSTFLTAFFLACFFAIVDFLGRVLQGILHAVGPPFVVPYA